MNYSCFKDLIFLQFQKVGCDGNSDRPSSTSSSTIIINTKTEFWNHFRNTLLSLFVKLLEFTALRNGKGMNIVVCYN